MTGATGRQRAPGNKFSYSKAGLRSGRSTSCQIVQIYDECGSPISALRQRSSGSSASSNSFRIQRFIRAGIDGVGDYLDPRLCLPFAVHIHSLHVVGRIERVRGIDHLFRPPDFQSDVRGRWCPCPNFPVVDTCCRLVAQLSQDHDRQLSRPITRHCVGTGVLHEAKIVKEAGAFLQIFNAAKQALDTWNWNVTIYIPYGWRGSFWFASRLVL